MNVCRQVLYRGHVQGVGFRYTTHHLAQRFAVTGYVRNLPDGRVELVAEGAGGEVDRFLEALGGQLAEYVSSREVLDLTPQGYTVFEIRP